MVTLSTDAFPVATFTAMGAPPMSASNWHCARVRAFAWLYCRDDHSRLAVARSTENTNRNTAEYRAPRVMGRRRGALATGHQPLGGGVTGVPRRGPRRRRPRDR